MAETAKLKIKAATAQEVCAEYALSDEAKPLLRPDMPPLDFVAALTEAKQHSDAVQFLARALPKREAVWWAALCAREAPDVAVEKRFLAAIEAAENWVRKPTEENRRLAEKAAETVKESHPARWSALGAFWSGGSLTPEGAPEVKPAEDLTAKAVAAAIMISAGMEAKRLRQRYEQFVGFGVDIAKGGTGRPAAPG